MPGEGKNINPIKFTDLTFEKADANKDKNNSRKRPFVQRHCLQSSRKKKSQLAKKVQKLKS